MEHQHVGNLKREIARNWVSYEWWKRCMSVSSIFISLASPAFPFICYLYSMPLFAWDLLISSSRPISPPCLNACCSLASGCRILSLLVMCCNSWQLLIVLVLEITLHCSRWFSFSISLQLACFVFLLMLCLNMQRVISQQQLNISTLPIFKVL